MTPQTAHEAAELLLKARGDHRQLARLPEECTPLDIDDANHIQDALAKAWRVDVAGWKIGAATEAAMEMLGCDEPFAGRVFAPYLLESPASVSAKALHRHAVEAEFAFRLAKDLRPRAPKYERDEIEAAIDLMYPAIELINDYWVDWKPLGVTHIVADNGSAGGLVLGEPVENWRALDLAGHRVSLSLDGEQVADGEGSVVLGHPLNTMVWLANDLSRRGIDLAEGQIVTTGTMTGLTFCEPGQTAVADFGALGQVQVTFET